MSKTKAVAMLAAIAGAAILGSTAASAQSCYDLWYQRNAIYDSYGYCFKSALGQRTFDNSDCWTSNPRLSPVDQRRVEQIRRMERRRGCRVNN